MPIGMNVAYILSDGMNHDIMRYSLWLVYLFTLLSTGWFFPEPHEGMRKVYPMITSILIMVILWGNVRMANDSYLVKDFEQDAYLSYATRVASRVETYDGYIQGVTPIAFVGIPEDIVGGMPEHGYTYELIGDYFPFPWWGMRYYYRYILHNDAICVGSTELRKIQQDQIVVDMPAFPHEGCMVMRDGVLIVKLGNPDPLL